MRSGSADSCEKIVCHKGQKTRDGMDTRAQGEIANRLLLLVDAHERSRRGPHADVDLTSGRHLFFTLACTKSIALNRGKNGSSCSLAIKPSFVKCTRPCLARVGV